MTKNALNSFFVIGCAIAAANICSSNATAQSTIDLSNYYIGVDNNSTIGFGGYTGLSNPNEDRLTLLFNHVSLSSVENSHYHPIGSYSYTGDVAAPSVLPTNSNNRLPETYTGLNLELAAAPMGSAYAGKLISGLDAGTASSEYGNLEIRDNTTIPDIAGYGLVGEPGTTTLGNAAYYMYTRGTQDFTVPMDSLDIELQLMAITPGLAVGDASGSLLMDQVNDTASLFSGSSSFTPTFFTDADAAPGLYSASFQLNDNSNTYASSGTFHFDFTVAAVPEPTSASLLGLGGLMLFCQRRRNA